MVNNEHSQSNKKIAQRFRQFLPVVVDVETAGFNADTDALLEVAAVTLAMDSNGFLKPKMTYHYHVAPFEGANLDPEALAFTGIEPHHPFRQAVSEHQVLTELFQALKQELKTTHCQRAVLVGHNPWFDLSFIKAACVRNNFNKSPFHHFTTFDTATLSALVFGQTVLAKAMQAANIAFDKSQAHSALYDADRTAELFCHIMNKWQQML